MGINSRSSSNGRVVKTTVLISNRTNRIIRMHKYTNTNTSNPSLTFSRNLPTFHTSWKYIQSRQHPDNGHNCENVHVMLRCYTVVCVTDSSQTVNGYVKITRNICRPNADILCGRPPRTAQPQKIINLPDAAALALTI